MNNTDKNYLLRIDHLRFFAAFLVVVWHFSHIPGQVPTNYVPNGLLLNIFEEGHTGVALFMVISGFVFEYVSFGKTILYGKFILNRVLRIFPLFIIFSLYAIYTGALPNPTSIVLNMLSFVSPKELPSVGWTIAVEFQFYLIFPFLHSFLFKKGPIYIFMIIIFFFLIRCMAFINFGSVQDMSYYTIFGRIDQFLIGMLLAYFYRKGMANKFNGLKLSFRYALSFSIFSSGILLISIFYRYFNEMGGFFNMKTFPSNEPIWIYFPTVEALCYSLLFFGYVTFPKNGLKYYDKAIGKLGELSYSIYWIHFGVCYAVYYKLFQTTDFNTALLYSAFIVTPIIICFSAISYYFIEKPFLNRRVKYHLE